MIEKLRLTLITVSVFIFFSWIPFFRLIVVLLGMYITVPLDYITESYIISYGFVLLVAVFLFYRTQKRNLEITYVILGAIVTLLPVAFILEDDVIESTFFYIPQIIAGLVFGIIFGPVEYIKRKKKNLPPLTNRQANK